MTGAVLPSSAYRLHVVATLAAFGAVLVAVHFGMGGAGMEARGAVLVLDHVFDLAAAVGLLAFCTAIGLAALRRLDVLPALEPLETLSFAAALGCGVVATSLLALGFSIGFRAPALLGLGGLLLLPALSEREALPSLAGRCARELLGKRTVVDRLTVAGLVVLAATLILLALVPPTDWDSLAYHVQVPAEWLRHGRIYLPVDNLHTAFAGLVHLLYVPLLALGSIAGPAMLSALFAMLLGLTVFAVGQRLFGRAVAHGSLWLLWGSPMLLLVAVSPRVDVTLAWYLLLAHFALIRAVEETAGTRLYILSGVLLGLAVGVKLFALPYALALAPLVVSAAPRKAGMSGAGRLTSLGIFVVAAGAAGLPWLLKNYLLLRAPLYPIVNAGLLEPWLAEVYRGLPLPAGFDPASTRIFEQFRSPLSLPDLFLRPQYLTPEVEGRFYQPLPLILLAPLAALLRPRRPALALAIPALLYVAVVAARYPYTNLRYLAPAIAPLTIVAVRGIVRVGGRLPKGAGRMGAALIVMSALVPLGQAVAWRSGETHTLRHAAGLASRADFLTGYWETSSYYATVDWANHHLPGESRILLLFEARGFYFEPETRQDNLIRNWRLLAPRSDGTNCLAELGVTHVFVNEAVVNYFRMRGLDPEAVEWSRFQAFRDGCLDRLFEAPGFALYGIAPTVRRRE